MVKYWLVACLSLGVMGFAESRQPTTAQGDARPEIMVLGTHHFTGGGYDYVNPEVDDYLSPRRQKEIIDVVERLAAFKPTKIALEVMPANEEALNRAYDEYRQGSRELGVSERQQIGMRLAAKLDHSKLYAIDFKNGGMDIGGLFELGQQTGQTDILDYLNGLQQQMSEQDARLNAPDVTLRERLLRENGDEVRDAHNVYLTLAQIGDKSNQLGAQEMGNWWARNMHIFANISHIAEPGDRILVIYGSGHKFLLDQFIRDSHEFKLADPRAVLKETD